MPVTGRSHFCPTCALRRNAARQSARRAAQRAARPVEVVGPWNPHVQPLLTRPIEHPPEPLSPALALQALEQACSQAAKVTGRIDLLSSAPVDRRVQDALTDCREARCPNDAIGAAIERGLRAGSGGRRVPSVLADEIPEEVQIEALLKRRVAV